MSDDAKDELRDRNRRRAHCCGKCGASAVRELDEAEKARRPDTFSGLRYRECLSCGNLWSSPPPRRFR